MQGYYGNLAQCDATFLEVLNAVDELGLRDKTLVIYDQIMAKCWDSTAYGESRFF